MSTIKKPTKKPVLIYLEHRQDHLLSALSEKKGISKAAIVRESVEKYLAGLPVEEDPSMGIIGLGDSGIGDLAENHDKYLAEYAKVPISNPRKK
jgi:hypothetical protein